MSDEKEILRLFSVKKAPELEHIDLTLYWGETLGIAGDTASGKTCLANIMRGEVLHDSGDVLFCGQRLSGAELKNKVFYADETSAVIDELTVAENIFLGNIGRFERLLTVDRERLISESYNALNFVGMSHISPSGKASRLNLGEKRLIELARLIKKGARVIILDNFFLSVDKAYRHRILKALEKYKLCGGAVVFITRDIDLAKEMCNRIVLMDDGKIMTLAERENLSEIQAQSAIPRKTHGESYEILLRAVNLCCESGIRNINFKLWGGEFLGILGLSDSGIHPLGRIVFGDIPLERGRISVGGHNIKSIKGAIRRKMAYINNDFGFERTVGVLESRRDIFILDGVLSGRNKSEKQKILSLIENICNRGGGVIFISEDIDEQMSLCDRILVLRAGELVGEYMGACHKKQITDAVIS